MKLPKVGSILILPINASRPLPSDNNPIRNIGISQCRSYANNCELNDKDRTYEALLFELNKVMYRYNINTCIRKINFLSQIYWESNTQEKWRKKYEKKFIEFDD